MPVLRVNDTTLNVERGGTGEPLLMVMGMGGSRLHWGAPFLDRVERDFEAIRYDHRGIGGSGPHEGELSIAKLADDALGLLDALGLERAHVLGISMGGMVAQELALAAPQRLRTLTLGCTWAGGPDGRFTDPQVGAALRDATLSGDRRRAIRTSWEFNFSAPYRADERRFATFYELASRVSPSLSVLAAQALACARHDTHARLAQITAPTLIMHGSADRIIDVVNAHLIAQRIPGARLELLEGAGHLFFWERPDRCAELLRDHAARAGAAAGL